MPKTHRVRKHLAVQVRPHYSPSTKKSPHSQEPTEKEDQGPPPKDSQFTTYDVVIICAMCAGFAFANLALIFLSCAMAIATKGPSITHNILLLIKRGA